MKIFFLALFISSTLFAASDKPVAKFTVSQSSDYLPSTIQFDASGSYDPDGTIVSYEWRFGDGDFGTGVQVTHTYTRDKNEMVRLTVTDNSGKKTIEQYKLKFLDDNSPPVITFDVPDNFKSYIPTPLITVFYSDANSKVNPALVEVALDDVVVNSHVVIDPNHAVLQFTPEWPVSPGLHTLRVSVQDYYRNKTTKTLPFSYVVTQPKTAFLNGEVYGTSGEALKGIFVQSVDGPVNAQLDGVTDASGKFSVPVTVAGEYKIQFSAPGRLPLIKFVTLLEGLSTNLGSVYLAKADPKVTEVSAVAGGSATNSTASIAIAVPAGVMNGDKLMSFTEAVTGKTLQLPLPNASQFTYAHNAQPSGTQFSSPASMWIKNILGFAPGTSVPIGVTEEGLGVWTDSGYKGVVSADGTKINFLVNHFSDYDLNYPSKNPPDEEQKHPEQRKQNANYNPCPTGDCPGTDEGASRLNSGTGNVGIDYVLPPVIRRGENVAKVFTYNSTTTTDQVSVGSRGLAQRGGLPTNVNVRWDFAGLVKTKEFESQVGIQDSSFFNFFSTVQPNGSFLESGAYPFRVTMSKRYDNRVYANAAYFGGPPIPEETTDVVTREPVYLTETFDSILVVNNQRNSPFGAGWNIEGYERLFPSSYGMLALTRGNEKGTYYIPINPGAGNYVVQKRAGGENTKLIYHRGMVYGADCDGNQVFRLDAAGRYTLIAGGDKNLKASLSCPTSIFPSRKGGYYIADSGNGRVLYLDRNGNQKTLGGKSKGLLRNPTFVTEDNVLAVHVVDGDSIKTISPHNGEVLETAGSQEGIFKSSLNRPSQIHYDENFNLIVLDPGSKKIFKLYMDNGERRAILEDKDGIKELAYDSLRNVYYLLTETGLIKLWKGPGYEETYLLDSTDGSFKVADDSVSRAKFPRFSSIAFSPMTGLILGTETGIKLRSLDASKSSSRAVQNYLSFGPDSSQMSRQPDGTYHRFLNKNVLVKFHPNGFLNTIQDLSTGLFEQYDTDSTQRLTRIYFSHNRGEYLFNYNSRGFIEEIIDPAGRSVHVDVDASGDVSQITDPEGQSQTFQYTDHILVQRQDEMNHETKYSYQYGRVVGVLKPGNRTMTIQDAIIAQVESYSGSQSAGVLFPEKISKTYVSPEGRKKGYVFHEQGTARASFDGFGNYTFYERNSLNLPVKTITPAGRESKSTYNFRGLIATSDDAAGKNTYIWSPQGRLLQSKDATGIQTTYEYDPYGNLLTYISPTQKATTYVYDPVGYPLKEIHDAAGGVTTFFRDPAGNIAGILDPIGQSVSMQRDSAGNVTTMIDQLGRGTSFEYDGLSRMTKSTDAMGGQTFMSYTAKGMVDTVTDARNKSTNFDYNEMNRVSSVTNPLNQTVYYTYDRDENLLSKTTKKNQLIQYTYDNNNRLISKHFENENVSFKYDRDGNLTKGTDSDSTADLGYDSKGRLVLEKGSHFNGKVEHGYDDRGNRVTTNLFLNNQAVMSVRRGFGGLKNIAVQDVWVLGKTARVTNDLDVYDLPAVDSFPNGIIRTIERDRLKRPYKIMFNGGGTNASIVYQYNPTGSITAMTELMFEQQPITSLFDYDGNQRLKREQTPLKSWEYSLDAVGNDLSNDTAVNDLNQTLQTAEYVYEYDLNGNRTKKSNRYNDSIIKYTWNAENQLTKATVWKGTQLLKTIDYAYDAIGRRIGRSVTDHIVPAKSYQRKYVYDGQQIIAVLNGAGEFLSAYVHSDGIDDPLLMVTDYDKDGQLNVLSFLKDHLGSVKLITNENREVVEEINYSAYGETQIKLRGQNKSRVGNNFYYTGREMEPETGDYYYRARYYDPYSQKFLSEDPASFGGGDTNLYRYVFNQPLILTDPYGKWPIWIPIMIGVGLIVPGSDFVIEWKAEQTDEQKAKTDRIERKVKEEKDLDRIINNKCAGRGLA